MSLLDDARRLAETEPVNSRTRCHWCDEFTLTEPHAPGCPWLAMPKIVVVLEAAERFLAALPEWQGYPALRDHSDVGGFGFCPICGESDGHVEACAYRQFVAALWGVEAGA